MCVYKTIRLRYYELYIVRSELICWYIMAVCKRLRPLTENRGKGLFCAHRTYKCRGVLSHFCDESTNIIMYKTNL